MVVVVAQAGKHRQLARLGSPMQAAHVPVTLIVNNACPAVPEPQHGAIKIMDTRGTKGLKPSVAARSQSWIPRKARMTASASMH